MTTDFEIPANMEDSQEEVPDLSQETPPDNVFIAPSIDRSRLLAGQSYTHLSAVPQVIAADDEVECVLGVDEAGRGPVLGVKSSLMADNCQLTNKQPGPMVYALLYLPITAQKPLLQDTHHFDDSKVLTPTVRSNLMQALCTADSDLHSTCGWAARVMSARDISAGMLKAGASYNLNAQAMDATIDLIKQVLAKGVNVREIYIDTIGSPIVYQRKLEKIFPTIRITVAKKADSLYPCVSAASVCAKVTRDAALEVCYESYQSPGSEGSEGWGSGYPSDARCSSWLKRNADPFFGWGPECRFSWGTAKDILEAKNSQVKVEWPEDDDDDDDNMKMSHFFTEAQTQQGSALSNWFGTKLTEDVF